MKRFKKVILCASIMLCAVGSVSAPVQAKQVGTVCGHPIFDNHFDDIEIKDGGSNTGIINIKNSYAPVYDPRVLGIATAVEDQGETNTCWAFATNAAIEANLIKKGYENSSLNLSENHLAYFFYNRQTDPLGYTKGDQNLPTTPDPDPDLNLPAWAENGGMIYGTAFAVSTWAGVVKDTIPTSEDDAQGEYVPFEIEDKSTCYKSDYVVKNVYMYNYSVSDVKRAITDHGAVACGIYTDTAYFSPDMKAYYYPKSGGNHAVTIVGWDDTYSRENFGGVAKPKGDGAWIVKNSWGPSVQDGGYMYISYEDKSISQITAYDMMSASERNDNNYQHDGTAHPASYIGATGSLTAANVFKAKASSAGYNEMLEAVSVCTYTTNVNYSLQIYTGVTSTTNPTKGKAVFSNPKRGMFVDAGYNRIELDSPVTLTAGEKYAVVITLSAPNGVIIGTEKYDRTEDFTFLADVAAGEGFLKDGDEWVDSSDFYMRGDYGLEHEIRNLRIKAFTSNTQQKTSYKLSNKSMGISKGTSTKVALKINPSSVKRKVTWSSSNKKVAKVSSNGKVTGKGYGKATIKAKFVAGSKTKTLQCTVTVGPSKIKNFKVQGAKKKITVNWKKNDAASGYEISYSKKKDGGYKTLTTVKSGSTTKCSKSLKKGTYYVKMRPYMTKDGKKLYGSYTSVKKVTVK